MTWKVFSRVFLSTPESKSCTYQFLSYSNLRGHGTTKKKKLQHLLNLDSPFPKCIRCRTQSPHSILGTVAGRHSHCTRTLYDECGPPWKPGDLCKSGKFNITDFIYVENKLAQYTQRWLNHVSRTENMASQNNSLTIDRSKTIWMAMKESTRWI